MQSPKAKPKTSTTRKWLKRIAFTVAIFILVPVGLFTIGWLNRDALIEELQDWYKENNAGTLTIGDVNANFISGFPKVGFTLTDIKQTNTDSITDKYSTIVIEEAKVTIGAGNLLRGNLKFEKIGIRNALISSEVISNRSYEYHQQLKYDRQNRERKGLILPSWLHEDGVEFSLENVQYIAKDSILNKYFNVQVNKFEGNFKRKDNILNGGATMDMVVNNLGFNTKKGSFFNGARVRGKPSFQVNIDKDIIALPTFVLAIDAQRFNLSADFDLTEASAYHFQLENDETDFAALKGLLPDSLASKLNNYKVQQPLKTSLDINGKFAYRNNPDIQATFSTQNNTIDIADRFTMENASFSGHLTNDIYETDSLRSAKKSRKDIKIFFDNIKATVQDIAVDIEDACFQSTPEAKNFIHANLNLMGKNETLATLIDTENFDFEGGRFVLNSKINGDIANPFQFLNKASGNFYLNNTRVILKKNGLQLPVETINITLNNDNSYLNKLQVNLPNGEILVFQGNLKNISGLISKNPELPTTSRISLDSESLNLNEVIAMATEFVPKNRTALDDRKNLHDIFEAIYGQFHPQFDLDIKVLQYKDVIIDNLKADLGLINSETILLRNFDFDYYNATTSLSGSVRVPEPTGNMRPPIFIDATANASGPIEVFQDLFNIQIFRIDSGDFNFYGNVTGNVKEFSELLNNANGDLTLSNTKLYYPPAEMDIVIDSLSLFVAKSDILLKRFNVEIGELYPMNLNGKIEQFPKFLLDDATGEGSIYLKVNAPYIDADNWLETVKSFQDEEKTKSKENRKALHTVFKDINKFHPEIELEVDSLKYQDLVTERLHARVFFENDSILRLNNLDLQYKETTANVMGSINAHDGLRALNNDNPFQLDFSVHVKGKAQDLNDYLKTINFVFTSGDFEFKGNYYGQSDALKILNSNAFGDLKISKATVDYRKADLTIPVDSLHVEINDNLATLKTMAIDLPNKSALYFTGSIDNFSDFINGGSEENTHSSSFSIYTPYLATTDIKEFLDTASISKEKTTEKPLNLKTFKEALVDINNSFYPFVDLKIDSLKHNSLDLTDLKVGFLFDNTDNFSLENLEFDFYGGSLSLNVDAGLKTPEGIPVKIDMKATNIDLHELVTRFDYFNDEDLRNTEKIEGNLNYVLKGNGLMYHDGKLNMDSLNGTLQLEVTDLEVYNYQPIMENSVMMKDERFKNLRFQPIVQTFEIKNGEIIIPRTEIQSTAIHVFVEGKLKFNEYMDIWLSLPWKNLKANDGTTLAEKTSYDKAGSKFFIQLLQDKNSDKARKQKLRVKVRLGNRKLRKAKK